MHLKKPKIMKNSANFQHTTTEMVEPHELVDEHKGTLRGRPLGLGMGKGGGATL